MLRLENLDIDIPPDAEAIARTRQAASEDDDNSYLPFVGQLRLREAVVRHVSKLSGVAYSAERNCAISAGGLSGIVNVLLARRLLEHGVCATAMTGWGEAHGGQYIRFVFANEKVVRLETLGDRVRAALQAR